MPLLMGLTIMAIAGFQVYWLSQAYEREERTLDMRTGFLFRETVFQLQSTKLKLDRLSPDSGRIFIRQNTKGGNGDSFLRPDPKLVSMIDVLVRKAKDSNSQTVIIKNEDTLRMLGREGSRKRNRVMQFLFDVDSLQDSVKILEINTTFKKRLDEQNLAVPFSINRIENAEKDDRRSHHQVTLGFANPITYKLNLGNKTSYLLNRISIPILFSIFLIAFTVLSFTVLYRNLLRQRRLADIKNEFISNITHELKTPIATVSVAIEALRNFSANINPQRTKEYLDISANELQRLSLLVDKVLKLSMFENKEIELKYEQLDMRQLVEEVTESMRLQFENRGAVVQINVEGDTNFSGDRLHIVSVIFNLLDNALKYSNNTPQVGINVNGNDNNLTLSVADGGIGIPTEFHTKVFEKFFRVPTGNLHNAKGYGLGLSYVAHVVQKHGGTIVVQSPARHSLGAGGPQQKGSTFVITLPKRRA